MSILSIYLRNKKSLRKIKFVYGVDFTNFSLIGIFGKDNWIDEIYLCNKIIYRKSITNGIGYGIANNYTYISVMEIE